uniref:Uncharacterized protein n=1 Tax=Oryza meridionalis TaxID=40149 RepID=A0A0E0E3N7_9ORYZ
MSVAGNSAANNLGHLHTVSLLSSSVARLLVSPRNGGGEGVVAGADGLIPRLCLGTAASRAAALDALVDSVGSLPPSAAVAAVFAVAVMLVSGEILSALREKAVSEARAVVPYLCYALEFGAKQACVALRPLTADSRDTAVGWPRAAGVLRNLAAFPDLLPTFRMEGALPSLIQLVSLGTPRAQELVLGCLQNLTSGDSNECQRLKVEAFQDGALSCVKDFLESCVGDEPSLTPAFGLLRYIAEIAVSASFVDHVLAALGSDKAATCTEAAMALAELCNVTSHGKTRRDGDAIPRLVWMLEAKAVAERDAAARKEEQRIVNVVQLLDPSTACGGVDARFPVSVLLVISPSRRCQKQMVAAGACGFLQGLLAAEVDGPIAPLGIRRK